MNLESLTRFKNKQMLGNHKADFWICTELEHKAMEKSIKTNCATCGIDCWYYPIDNSDMLKKNHKKICIKCALKRDDINDETRNILEKAGGEI